MAFKVLRPVSSGDSLGQSWSGDEITENIRLCEYQTIRHVFERCLTREMEIIEAGCGLGRWVFYLREKGFKVWGVEISNHALALLKPFDPNGYIKKGDVCNLPFPDGSVDAVISLGVVEHFETGPERALLEARRVLSDEGLLLISIPPNTLLRRICTHPLLSFRYLYWKLRNRPLTFSEYHFSEGEFSRILQKQGFTTDTVVTDELDAPKSMGLCEWPFFRSRKGHWELNLAGRIARAILDSISPAISRGGVLFVCRKAR